MFGLSAMARSLLNQSTLAGTTAELVFGSWNVHKVRSATYFVRGCFFEIQDGPPMGRMPVSMRPSFTYLESFSLDRLAGIEFIDAKGG
jgi:hypothetical protein